jgi:hypothetical protein
MPTPAQLQRSPSHTPPLRAIEPKPGEASRHRAARSLSSSFRLARVLLIAVAATLGAAVLLILPVSPGWVPLEVQLFVAHPLMRVLAIALVLVLGPARILGWIPRRTRERLMRWVRRALSWRPLRITRAATARAAAAVMVAARGRLSGLEALAARLLRGPATVVAGALSLLFVATWVPHYLTWPWWADIDQFAVSAQAWSVGILPYRDQLDFDFPGPIYLHFVLGMLFGWGATVAFHAVDAALVVVLGVALAAWSRRLFGSALPGLVSFLTFLAMYLGLDFSLVAQRDWHGPLLVVLGLLASEVWRGRRGRAVSALAMGLALAVRPQEIVFLPAMVAAVDDGERPAGQPWQKSIRPLVEWSLFLAVSLLLAFAPLIAAGTLDDLWRALTSARQGPYNVNTFFWFSHHLGLYFEQQGTFAVLAGVVVLAVAGPAALRGPARTWALALLGAFFYKPISLWPHRYLDQPVALLWAINLAILVAWLLTAPRLIALARLAAIGAIVACCVPGVPRFCDPARSVAAIGPLLRGADPVAEPPGCTKQFASPEWPSSRYRWDDYRAVLDFLRGSTPPQVPVANLLWNVPYPPVNGPTGHLTPFPAAGGYVHLWMVDPSLIDEYVAILRKNEDLIVVWSPGKKNPFFPKLDRAVRASYCPAARFGAIEVWRHKAPGRASRHRRDARRPSGDGHLDR